MSYAKFETIKEEVITALITEFGNDEGEIIGLTEKALRDAWAKAIENNKPKRKQTKSKTKSPKKNPLLIPYREEKLTQKNRDAGWTGYYKDCYVERSRHARYREDGKVWVTSSLQEAIAKAEAKKLTAVVEVKDGYECRLGNRLYKNPRNHWRLGMASYVKGEFKLAIDPDVGGCGNLREYVSPYDEETETSSVTSSEAEETSAEETSSVTSTETSAEDTSSVTSEETSSEPEEITEEPKAELTQEKPKAEITQEKPKAEITQEKPKKTKKIVVKKDTRSKHEINKQNAILYAKRQQKRATGKSWKELTEDEQHDAYCEHCPMWYALNGGKDYVKEERLGMLLHLGNELGIDFVDEDNL